MVQGEGMVDRADLAAARQLLGSGFVRVLGYFREDGIKSVAQIEAAMRAGNAAAMVLPAHTLKGESRQFGGTPLADLAEVIEDIARGCVEDRDDPAEALEHVVALRPLFERTLAELEQDTNPLVARKPGFGRRALA